MANKGGYTGQVNKDQVKPIRVRRAITAAGGEQQQEVWSEIHKENEIIVIITKMYLAGSLSSCQTQEITGPAPDLTHNFLFSNGQPF